MSNYQMLKPSDKDQSKHSKSSPSVQFSEAILNEDGLATNEVLERQASYG